MILDLSPLLPTYASYAVPIVGRFGIPIAANPYEVSPAMMMCAKGLASGGMLMTGVISKALRPGDLDSTFGDGPLARTALIATLKVTKKEQLLTRTHAVKACIRSGIEVIVRHVRDTGLLLGLKVGKQAATLKAYLVDRHILVGGLDDPGVLRLMLPLTVNNAAIDALPSAVNEFAAREAVA